MHIVRRAVVVAVRVAIPMALAAVGFAANTDRALQEDDIREMVFRHQFDHNASGQQKTAHAYYLALGEKDADPSDQFMKRFTHHRPPVRKASARHSTSVEIVDKGTGKPGLLFRISTITWISDSEVRVEGGYDEANVSASQNTYTVKKHEDKWEVTDDRMNAISEVTLPAPLPKPPRRPRPLR